MFRITTLLALLTVLCAQPNPPREPIARVGEVEIYEEDLIPSIGAQLWQLKNQEYELKLKTLTRVIKERLLENEAKKKRLSTEAFLEQNVDRSVPPSTAIEIETFYLAQKDTWN